jgi:hypothetical protein
MEDRKAENAEWMENPMKFLANDRLRRENPALQSDRDLISTPSTRNGSSVTVSTPKTLEKAVYELGYGLNNRSSWVMIPIQGVQQLLSAQRENEKRRGRGS